MPPPPPPPPLPPRGVQGCSVWFPDPPETSSISEACQDVKRVSEHTGMQCFEQAHTPTGCLGELTSRTCCQGLGLWSICVLQQTGRKERDVHKGRLGLVLCFYSCGKPMPRMLAEGSDWCGSAEVRFWQPCLSSWLPVDSKLHCTHCMDQAKAAQMEDLMDLD